MSLCRSRKLNQTVPIVKKLRSSQVFLKGLVDHPKGRESPLILVMTLQTALLILQARHLIGVIPSLLERLLKLIRKSKRRELT